MRAIKLKDLEDAVRELLLSKPKGKVKYENMNQSDIEKNQKWRLEKRKLTTS